MTRDFIPYCGVYPGKLTFYSLPDKPIIRDTPKFSTKIWNLMHNESKGILSNKAAKKIKLAIDWLLFLANDKKVFSKKHNKHFNFKINFVTLTLSSTQRHSDQTIKDSLLSQFLRECKIYHKIENYLWRAESQKNGNIHFHIVTDKFLPWDWLQKTWNRIQNKLGYVDSFSKNMQDKFKSGFIYDKSDKYQRSYSTQYNSYLKGSKNNWTSPNSTDVHSVKHIRNISNYLAKYCTKNPENCQICEPSGESSHYYSKPNSNNVRAIEGTIWNLSNSLSKFKRAVLIIGGNVEDELRLICDKFKDKLIYYDYTSVLYVPVYIWSKLIKKELFTIFYNYSKNPVPV